MKLFRPILITFAFLLLVITTTTIALFFRNNLLNNTNNSIGSSEHIIIRNITSNFNSSIDNNMPLNISVSDFTNDFIYNDIGPSKLFQIYESDIRCSLLRSPYIRCRSCAVILSDLRKNFNNSILDRLKQWENHSSECQKNNISNLCTPFSDGFMMYLDSIRRLVMSAGFVCKCDDNRSESFCKEISSLNKLANQMFSNIILNIKAKELDLNQYIPIYLHSEMIKMSIESNKTFYGCSQDNDKMNYQGSLNGGYHMNLCPKKRFKDNETASVGSG